MPKISVIVPVYNTEKYLHRCIDSILAQTFTDFELLLINDGSKDNSGKICDEYAAKDPRIRVFHKENGGASSARNLGLDNAKGEWLTFVDSDDYIFENYLQNYICQISENVDIICQGMEFDKLFSEKHPIKHMGTTYKGNIQKGIEELYKSPMPGSLCNKCFKTKIINEQHLRFNTNITFREDEIFVLNYSKYCTYMLSSRERGYFYYLPQWGVKYKFKNDYYNTIKEIYKIHLDISDANWNYILSDTLYELTTEFINILPNNNKRKRILDYRKNVGKNIFKTQLFILTKLLIFLDKTGYFSTLYLTLHLYIKAKIASLILAHNTFHKR